MPTFTSNYGLNKPLPFDQTDADVWGGYLNENFDDIDSLLKTAIDWKLGNKGGNYTVLASDDKTFFELFATTASFTITLPPAASVTGQGYIFKRMDNVIANTITIKGNGTELIDGSNTFLLTEQYQSIRVVSNGTYWILATKTSVAIPIPQLRKFVSETSGNFTTPANITNDTEFKIILTGGGAGGANVSGANTSGSGGGSGATAIIYINGLDPSTNYVYTIGNGGGAGSNGSPSSIVINGLTINAGGAAAGSTTNTFYFPSIGGIGGSVSSSGTLSKGSYQLVSIQGGSGTPNSIFTNSGAGGNGGASFWGGGGTGGQTPAGFPAIVGGAYGSGGGGGVGNQPTGGAGRGGIIQVEYIA